MSAKTVPNSVFIGNEGAYLVPQIVNEMRFLWTPSGQFELGIDGTIEIVDSATAKGTGNIIKAQIKTTSQPWPEENESGFAFALRETDLNYWVPGEETLTNIGVPGGLQPAVQDRTQWSSNREASSRYKRIESAEFQSF
jgi:hypothetical protein